MLRATSSPLPAGASLPTGANPSATVGTAAVNGVATTFMRSDAAPAINLAMVPTWTGAHTFSGAVALNGGVTSFRGVNTVGNGLAAAYAKDDRAAQAANIGATTLYAVPANKGGLYRVSCYAVATRAATTSSTLPNIGVLWTDDTSNTPLEASNVTPTNTANAIGAFGQGVQIVSARAGTNIQFQTSNYASSGATTMEYATHIIVEYLG